VRATHRSSGYSLAELLVVLVIVALLAAITIPILLSQRSSATNTAIRTDLGVVAAAVNTRLLAWGGTPPSGAVAICHLNALYPTDPVPVNTCPQGRWESVIAATGGSVVPALSGSIGTNVRIQGFIDEEGNYCLEGTSPDSDATFFTTADDETIRSGTCVSGGWVQASPPEAPELDTPVTVPAAPANVYVTTTSDSATVYWDAIAGETYSVTISGQPTRTVTAGATGTASCLFPALTCGSASTTSALSAGTYVAQVRRKGDAAWGPASRIEFGIPVSVTATPTVTVTVTEEPADPAGGASVSNDDPEPTPNPSPSPSLSPSPNPN